ncbi:hypothetical protein MJ1_0715 [Nanobdella aerobiophila]|uniref:Uncharacterized protein n=1 Tax=Nanobdella aerobiophila TaxID=2586965 RepID=A0A915SIS6_9ARCH|nr:hypothetical protein [Nanobdella aerobiophila]BBL45857.1 hypothetical protein MJ1_0715 [Nanobdella aerobiophila]
MDLGSYIYLLFSEYGIFTIVAPFLLIFSLLYGLLRKTGLFGKDNPNKERLYAIISIALSFYYLYNLGAVIFTQDFISFFFFEFLVLFFILMIIGLLASISQGFQPKEEEKGLYNKYKNSAYNSLVGILGLLVLFAFMYASSFSFTSFGAGASNILYSIFSFLINTGLLPLIIIFGVLFGIIGWLVRTPNKSPNKRKINPKLLLISAGEAPYQFFDEVSKK